MPQSPTSSALNVYQLRVVIRSVSPLIWRRLLVRSDSTGTAETSQEHSLSSSNRLGCREGLIFGIGLARLEAVVEAAEEAVEQVALCGGVPITGHATPVVVSSGTG